MCFSQMQDLSFVDHFVIAVYKHSPECVCVCVCVENKTKISQFHLLRRGCNLACCSLFHLQSFKNLPRQHAPRFGECYTPYCDI